MRRPASAAESGFTLVEVLAAIVILGIVAVSALAFSIQGIHATATTERRQVAASVAIEAMEEANARVASTEAGSGVSFLMSGRDRDSVGAAWSAYATADGVSETYPGWDPRASAGSAPAVPLTKTATRNGTDYAVTTLIGWCYQSELTGDCRRIPGVLDPPATAPAGWAERLIRVIAIVEWSAGDQCSTVPCRYQTVTLIDGSGDLEWRL